MNQHYLFFNKYNKFLKEYKNALLNPNYFNFSGVCDFQWIVLNIF